MKRRLTSLDVLRGIAVIMIVVHHVTTEAVRRHNHLFLSGFFRNERGAVDLFFILSGFILLLTYYKKRGKNNQFLPFLVKRLQRIIPLYWFICSFVIALYLIWRPPIADLYRYDFSFFIGNFFLIPGSALVITPAWFLMNEIIYYLLFAAVIFLFRKHHLVYVLTLFFICLVALIVNPPFITVNATVRLIFSVYTLEFLSGILLGYAYLYFRRHIAGHTFVIAGTLLFLVVNLAVASINQNREVYETALQNIRFIFFGAPAFFIILGLVKMEDEDGFRAFPKTLILIGKSSYAIYLSHMVIMQSLFMKSQRVMRLSGPFGGYDIGIALITLLAIVIPTVINTLYIRRSA